jgi:DNA-binding CsgD family transcriptional regulator
MEDLARVARISQIYAQAQNANDYCRRLTHDPDLGNGILGTQLFALSNRGTLHCVGSYGLEGFDPNTQLNLFEDNPISEAINSRNVWVGELEVASKTMITFILPLIKGDVPVGAGVSVTDPKAQIVPFSPQAVIAAGNAGAIYLESLGLKNLFRESPANGDSELTDRQYEILLGMARGETNAEIAKQMILSESSIKQESVRIFRALGVGSRQQAVAKAKATGLIPAAALSEEVA